MAQSRFAEKLGKLFGIHKRNDEDFFENLTDSLIEGDIGAKTAFEITTALEKRCKELKIFDQEQIVSILKEMLLTYVKSIVLEPEQSKENIFMLLGVNGAGKTTTAAKLSRFYSEKGINVILAAADTFRAAAIEQLSYHGEKIGLRVVAHQHGADPSAVVFDAAEAIKAQNGGLVIADTAGRLHNKENLVRELQKIDRIATQKSSEGCYKKILTLDATTGQNAVRQAEVFNDAVGVDAVVLTKYDSSAKGGIAITLGRELGIPVAFVCTGENYDDISIFNPEKYVTEFLEG